MKTRRGDNRSRGIEGAVAAHPRLVAAAVSAYPFRADDLRPLPDSPRGDQVSKAREILGRNDHPTGPRSHGNAVKFVRRIKIGERVGHPGIEVGILAHLVTNQPVPSLRWYTDDRKQALVEYGLEVAAPDRRESLREPPVSAAAIDRDRPGLGVRIVVVERVTGPVRPLRHALRHLVVS